MIVEHPLLTVPLLVSLTEMEHAVEPVRDVGVLVVRNVAADRLLVEFVMTAPAHTVNGRLFYDETV